MQTLKHLVRSLEHPIAIYSTAGEALSTSRGWQHWCLEHDMPVLGQASELWGTEGVRALHEAASQLSDVHLDWPGIAGAALRFCRLPQRAGVLLVELHVESRPKTPVPVNLAGKSNPSAYLLDEYESTYPVVQMVAEGEGHYHTYQAFPQICFILDSRDCIASISPEAQHQLGASLPELLGKPLVSLAMEPEQLEQALQKLKLGSVREAEIAFRAQGGQKLWLELSIRPQLSQDGNSWLLGGKNISERVKLRTLTDHNTQFFKVFAELGQGQLYIVDLERMQLIWANESAWQAVLQHPDAQRELPKATEELSLLFQAMAQIRAQQAGQEGISWGTLECRLLTDDKLSWYSIQYRDYNLGNGPARCILLLNLDEHYKAQSGFQMLEKVAQQLSQGLWVFEMTEQIPVGVFANTAWTQFWGGELRQWLGTIDPHSIVSELAEVLFPALQGPSAQSHQRLYVPADSSLGRPPLDLLLYPIEDRAIGPKWVLICYDASLRLALEAERASIMQVVLRAQEEERSYLSKELHDSLGQLLSSIRINCSLGQRLDVAGYEAAMQHNVQMLDQAIDELRNLTRRLTPPALEAFGLQSALNDLGEQLSRSWDGAVNLNLNLGERRFAQEWETHIFRIVQESINNSLKHAHARNIFLEMTYIDEKTALLFYEDDGQGFDAEKVAKGHGLRNIELRVSMVKGQLWLETQPGYGFTLLIHLPLPA